MANLSWRSWLTRLSRRTGGRGRPTSRVPRLGPPVLELLEDRTLLSVTIAGTNNNGNGYSALDFNKSGGYTPPDTVGAAGPTNSSTGLGAYVETVNQTIALYPNKAAGSTATGANAPQTSSLSNFWYTTGGLSPADGGAELSDPMVAYDDQIGRFVVGDQDIDFSTHVSKFDFAVSKTSDPTSLGAGDWTFYQINTTQSGFDADYPGNFGYNHDAFVFTLNMFGVSGGGHVQVVSVNSADLSNDVSNSSLHVFHNNVNDFSLRPVVMHDAKAGDPMWFVTEHGDGTSIDVIKDTNVLSNSSTFAYTNLAVTPYFAIADPLNPNGSEITNNIDTRIMKAAEANNTIVATHSVGIYSNEDDAQWYAIDVSSGTPVLKQEGRVSGGANTYVTYPGIDINSSGQIGMTYMKSGTDSSTDYMSMYVTGRNTGDPTGTMETPVLVPAGTGKANYSDFSGSGRAGDLSGINVDPTDGSFWAANEYANTEPGANWGTAVANFTIGTPLPSTDMAVSMSPPGPISVDVTSGAVNETYTITVTNNGPNAAQGVVLSDALPAGSSFVSMTKTGGSDGFTLSQSGGTVKETATGSLASGASDTFTLVVSAPGTLANGATFNNTATVSASNPDSNSGNNSATVDGTIVNNNSADMAVTMSPPGPLSVNVTNGAVNETYTITITNNGPGASQGVVLTDALPAGANFVSMSQTGGSDGFSLSQSGGTVTETATGSIASGASDTFTLVVSAPSTLSNGAAFNNTATVSASTTDPNASNNRATVNGTIVNNSSNNADMAVTMSPAGPISVNVTNGAVNETYTITITNNGPNAAQGVVLTDTLPTGANYVSMLQTGGTDGFLLNPSGGTVTATADASIASGASDTFTLTVSAPSTLSNGAAFNNTATVSTTNSDPTSSNNSATVNGTIVNNSGSGADVGVSFMASSPTAVEGATITYYLAISNTGPATATGVTLTDTLGPMLNFQTATAPSGATYNVSGSVVTFSIGSLASGSTVYASVTAQATEDGNTSDSASVTSTSSDPNPTNNSVSATTSVSEDTINVSSPITTTGPTFSGQVATFTHAQGVEPATAFSATINWGDGSTSTGTVTLSNGTYIVNGSHSYGTSGNYTIATTVTENDSQLPPADMAVTASGPSSVTAGTNATYLVTITNNGPNAAQGVVLSDALPAGSSLVSITHTAGSDGFTFSQSGGTIAETATGSIASGASDTFSVVVSAPSSLGNGAPFNDTATVSASNPDPNSGNNSATVDGTIVNNNNNADMAVTMSPAGPISVNVTNGAVNETYTITITNNGPSAAQGVVLTDTLPTGANYVSMLQTGGTDGFLLNPSGGTVTATANAGIASGASDTFTLTVSAPSTLSNGAAFNNTATVSTTNSDPTSSNNSATVDGTIVNNSGSGADVNVSFVASSPTAVEGATITYYLAISNSGPATATGVTLTDTLGPMLKYVTSTAPAGATVNVSGSVVTFSIGSLASGSTVDVSVTAQVTEDGSTGDSASVTSTSSDPNPSNNSASATTSVSEDTIKVSAPITTKNHSVSGQVATFTHAQGVEATSAFNAVINWGDGRTSTGAVTLVNGTYVVKGSHTYSSGGRHTIKTTVTEKGNGVSKADVDPATLAPNDRDVVRLPQSNSSTATGSPPVSPPPAPTAPPTVSGTAQAQSETPMAELVNLIETEVQILDRLFMQEVDRLQLFLHEFDPMLFG